MNNPDSYIQYEMQQSKSQIGCGFGFYAITSFFLGYDYSLAFFIS